MILIEKRGMCPRKLPDSMLPDVCLQIAGGGYTASQTANAMLLKSKVEQDGVGKYKGVKEDRDGPQKRTTTGRQRPTLGVDVRSWRSAVERNNP